MAAEDVPPVEEEGGARLPGWAQGVRSWVLGHKAQSAFIGGGLLLVAFFFTGGGSDPAPAGGPESPAPADDRFVVEGGVSADVGVMQALNTLQTDVQALRLGMEDERRQGNATRSEMADIRQRTEQLRTAVAAEVSAEVTRHIERELTRLVEESFAETLAQTLAAVEEERQQQMAEIPVVNPLQILYPRGGAGAEPGEAGSPAAEPAAEAPPTPEGAAAASPAPDWVRLPAGSAAEGRLLTGTFATALDGGGLPVLVALDSAFSGPNGARIDLQGCLVIGMAAANMRSIRVEVQARALSCVLPGGEPFESGLNGYLAGEDAVMGVPGIFEKRNGRWLGDLAASMGAAAAAAVGDVQIAEAIGGGGGTILSGLPSVSQTIGVRLQEFFLERANDVIPSVRVEAGKQVYLVVLEGVTITGLPARLAGDAAGTGAFGVSVLD